MELIRSEGGSDPGISVPNPHLTGAAGVDASPLVTQGSQFSLEDMEERKKKKKDEIVTVVVTAGQLLRALQRGDAHVEIQAHLNVTGKYFGMFRNHYHVVGPLPRSVLSIQVCLCLITSSYYVTLSFHILESTDTESWCVNYKLNTITEKLEEQSQLPVFYVGKL